MTKKLIFLSRDQADFLKLNFTIIIMLCFISFGFYSIGPTFFMKNGTSVISSKNEFSVLIPKNLTSKQYELLNFAYVVAKKDGFLKPEYLQGLLIQESNVGYNKNYRVSGDLSNKENQYYGIGQIKLVAALDVLKNFPEMWQFLQTKTTEELLARLILDDYFNIRIASKYLLLMGINKSASFAITAYNRGLGGAKNITNHDEFDYTKSVINHSSSSTIKNINKSK